MISPQRNQGASCPTKTAAWQTIGNTAGERIQHHRQADLPVIFGEAKATVTPMGDTLRFAGTLELAGLNFSINQRRVGAILRAARNYLPAIKEFDSIRTWQGMRPYTPDGLPVIARAKSVENLMVAGGHATLGVSLGPVTGKLVSQIAAGDKPLISLGPLALERF